MGFFDNAKDFVEDKVDEAKEAVDNAVDEAQDTAENVQEEVSEAVDDVKEGARDTAEEVSEGDVGGAVEEAVETGQDVVSGSRDTGSSNSGGTTGGSRTSNPTGSTGSEPDGFNDGSNDADTDTSTLQSFKESLPGNNNQNKERFKESGKVLDREEAKDGDVINNNPGEKAFLESPVEAQLSIALKQEKEAQVRETSARERAERYLEANQNYREGQEQLQNLNNRIESIDKNQTYILDRNGSAEGGKTKVSGSQLIQDLESNKEELKENLASIADNQGKRLQNLNPSDKQVENKLRNLIQENPGVASLSINLENARSGTGNVQSVKQRIKENEEVTMNEIEKYQSLSQEFTSGEIKTIQGEELSQSLTDSVAKNFDSSNPVVNAFTRGLVITDSVLDEAGEAIGITGKTNKGGEPEFKYKQTVRNTGKNFKSLENSVNTSDKDLLKGKKIEIDTGDDPTSASLEDALTYSEERADNLADAFGQGTGAIAATPLQVVRRVGQAQQLVSGELTVNKAIEDTKKAGSAAVTAAKEKPVKTGVTILPGVLTGSAASQASKLKKTKIDSELKAKVNRLTEKNKGNSALGEGFAQVKTRVKKPFTRRLFSKNNYKEFGTQINTPGIQGFDKSGNLYGKAVTRTQDGKQVNKESFVASSIRKKPRELEGRPGEASTISTKLELENGKTKFIESDSTLAGKIEAEDFVEYYRQSSSKDTNVDKDLSKTKTRIYKAGDQDSGTGSTVSTGSKTGQGGTTGGSGSGGSKLEIEQKGSSTNRLDITPGGINQESAQALAQYSVRNSGELPDNNIEANIAGIAASAQQQTQQRQVKQANRDTGMTVSTVDTSYSPETQIQETNNTTETIVNKSAKRQKQRFKQDTSIAISTSKPVQDTKPGVVTTPENKETQKILENQENNIVPGKTQVNKLKPVPTSSSKLSTVLIETQAFQKLQQQNQKTLLQTIQTPTKTTSTFGTPGTWKLPDFSNNNDENSEITIPRRRKSTINRKSLRTDWLSANLVEQETSEEAVYSLDGKPGNSLFGLKTVQERKGKVEQPEPAEIDIDIL